MVKPPAQFSLPVAGTGNETSTPVYRHPDFADKELIYLFPDPEKRTVWDLVALAAKKWPQAKCHGRRYQDKSGKAGPFTWLTFQQVIERAKNFASGASPYMKQDVTGEFKLLGLMGINHPDWTTAEWACAGLSGTTVPMYSTTPQETVEYILELNGCAAIVADGTCASTLIKAKPKCPTFETLIVYGVVDMSSLKSQGEAVGLKVLSFDEVVAEGRAKPVDMVPPRPDTVYSFIFTSGSTGMPKGALLTHEAMLSILVGAFYEVDKIGIGLKPGGYESHLSYLPSAHVMERAFQLNISSIGGAVGFFQGKREELINDLQTLRPTVFPSVPRLLNLIYDKIMNKVRSSGGLKQKLFNMALNAKLAGLKHGKQTHPLWDALVFKKIKKGLGLDRCRFIITGSAPIAGAVLDFYRAAFGLFVMEGYGATETCASGTMTHPYHWESDHVGGPIASTEIKLVSIPEMNYLVTDDTHTNGMKVKGRGEICIRGKCLMREYYRNPEATQKALDKDGWYHTGDVGCILANGAIKIFDRVGNVFKLSIGEYVAPEKVENICTRSGFVANVFVHGDAFHPKLVAMVVPDPEAAAFWAKENGVSSDLKALVADPKFKKAVLADIDKVCKSNGLQSYEVPKDITFDPEPFSVDTVLTPTLKIQRKRAMEHYKTQLSAMLGEAA